MPYLRSSAVVVSVLALSLSSGPTVKAREKTPGSNDEDVFAKGVFPGTPTAPPSQTAVRSRCRAR